MKTFFLCMKDELRIVKEDGNTYSYNSHLLGTQPVQVAVDPKDKQLIYCATYGHGLWRSTDGGDSWTALGKQANYHHEEKAGIDSQYVTSVAVHYSKKENGNHLVFVGTEPSKLYVSNDLGESWKEYKEIQFLNSKIEWQYPPRPYTHHVRWITPSYDNEQQLNVSIEFGAFISSEDGGETWNDRPLFGPRDTHTLLAHSKQPGHLYAACGDAMFIEGHSFAESDDEGKTWKFNSEGLEEHPYLYNMTIHPEDADEILVSASKDAIHAHFEEGYSTVYKKRNDGKWIEFAKGLPREGAFSHNLLADPSEPGTYYALNNFGLYKLESDTAEWVKMDLEWKDKFHNQHTSCIKIVDYS